VEIEAAIDTRQFEFVQDGQPTPCEFIKSAISTNFQGAVAMAKHTANQEQERK
jgi:hypothetical protein